MRFPVDADLFFFLAAIANVVSSLPRLRSLPTSKIPVRYETQEVPQAAMTDLQAKYFAPYDEKLAAMNYWPVCTYRIANYGRNLIRNYVNPMDSARCVVMINEVPPVQEGKLPPTDICTTSFHTRFSDGTIFTTRNMTDKSILDQPPYWIVQELPGLNDLAEMKREHDQKAASIGPPVSPPSDTKSVFDDIQSEHQRFSEFQLANGGYLPLPDGNSYALADPVYWRAIRNHLNPFAQNLSMRRFLPAVLIAIGLPLSALKILAPAAAHAALNIGFPPVVAARCVTLACYVLAGAVLGYLLERNTFLWALLLTYLALRVTMVLPLGAPPDGTLAATVACCVAQAKKRRRTAPLFENAGPSDHLVRTP
jgi:hypothetical protein